MTYDPRPTGQSDFFSFVEVRFDYLLYRIFQRASIPNARLGAFLYVLNNDTEERAENADDIEPTFLAGAFHEPIDTQAQFSVPEEQNVQDVLGAIMANLSTSTNNDTTADQRNIWEIATLLDQLRRGAVAQAMLPDGSLVMGGALYSPYQPPTSVKELYENNQLASGTTSKRFGSREWMIVVTAANPDDDFGISMEQLSFVILCAVVIGTACTCLVLWVWTSQNRAYTLSQERTRVAPEKAVLRVSHARQAVRNERELNDFIAHEVRNPLSAALSATSFISAAVHEQEPLASAELRQAVREDVGIVESSLQFINDLLRNMLDIHRVSTNKLILQMVPLDVKYDILEPVASMLYSRSSPFTVEVECPEDLVIISDKIRLKQVVLNLGRNAAKFVEQGYVRLRADVSTNDHKVVLFVEDSGPGIPEDKRQQLFRKVQQSLDTLQQGTGIGLAVCRSIVSLMGGKIELDESFQSGIPGCPGTRFAVHLETTRVPMEGIPFAKTSISMFQLQAKQPGQATSLPQQRNLGEMDGQQSLLFGDRHQDCQLQVSDTNTASTSSVIVPSSSQEIQQVAPPPPTSSYVHESSLLPLPTTNDEKQGMDRLRLPQRLSVLFVDDDMMLRKLFKRAIQRVAPLWEIEEAGNGETALRLADERDKAFDLISMDMYMASVDKQLLGTETVRALRSKGVTSIICGLSANNLEIPFLESGANAFMIKPLPCEKEALVAQLVELLRCREEIDENGTNQCAAPDE